MKLNLGAGDSKLEGFTPLDAKLGHELYPLAFATGTAEEIYASHVLEHFPRFLTQEVVNEWARVLKPGGLIKIAVPDLAYAFNNRDHPHFEGWLMGGQIDGEDFHCTLFNHSKLWSVMTNAGLVNIHIWKSEIGDCASLPVSLNLAGFKPVSGTTNPAPVSEVKL